MDGGHGPHGVIDALGAPAGDAGVEAGISHREEERHVVVEAVTVALGDELGEEIPVAGGELGVRPVGPVLGDDLLAIREPSAVVENLLGLDAIGIRLVPGRRGRTGELVERAEGEGDHPAPMGPDKFLVLVAPAPVRDQERLPPVGVVDEIGATRQGGVGEVDRTIPRPIRVRDTAWGEVAELIGPIIVAKRDARRRRRVAHAHRSGRVESEIPWVVPEGGHRGDVGRNCRRQERRRREQVLKGPVGGEADRLGLVRRRALVRRTPELSAQTGPDCPVMIRGPGVEHARIQHCELPRHHGRARACQADGLERHVVPKDARVPAYGQGSAGKRPGWRQPDASDVEH